MWRLITTAVTVLLLIPVAAASLAAGAPSTAKIYRIGYLSSYPLPPQGTFNVDFVPAMRELGYVEGQNLMIEIRSADNRPERLRALAADLVRLRVDVIVTADDAPLRAAKQATNTIPIVMAPSGDPVRAGYVASLARPGGNITGVSWMSPDLTAKLLEILKEAAPGVSRVAVLWNAANPVKVLDFAEARRAAQTLGLIVFSIEVKAPNDLEAAFAEIARARANGLLTLVDEVLTPSSRRIAEFAVKQRLPSILGQPQYAAAGGLLAYAPTMMEVNRRAAIHVDKILKGVMPADLPIEQPTKFELVINVRTAMALGLTIPPAILLRAHQLIE